MRLIKKENMIAIGLQDLKSLNCDICNKIDCDYIEQEGVYICKECLVKACLLVNPINFSKEYILYFFEATIQEVDLAIKNREASRATKKNLNNFVKFVEFVKPFLDSK